MFCCFQRDKESIRVFIPLHLHSPPCHICGFLSPPQMLSNAQQFFLPYSLRFLLPRLPFPFFSLSLVTFIFFPSHPSCPTFLPHRLSAGSFPHASSLLLLATEFLPLGNNFFSPISFNPWHLEAGADTAAEGTTSKLPTPMATTADSHLLLCFPASRLNGGFSFFGVGWG